MNCMDAQRLIVPFINKELNINQLEEFLHHVNSCPNCMEELEVYYVLLAGMKQLDEDKELSTDFNQDLKNLLRQAQDRIIHEKFLHIRKRIVLIILISVVAVISSFRIGEFVVEDVLSLKKSNFYQDNIFTPDKSIRLEEIDYGETQNQLANLILSNLSDIYVYLRLKGPEGAKLMKEKFGDRIWENAKVKKNIGMQFNLDDWNPYSY